MLLENDMITVKQTLFLLIGNCFDKCEIWTSKDYLATHIGSRSFRSSQIAIKYMDILISNGIPPEKAQQQVISNGSPRLSKKNLKLLGEPIVVGSVAELSNHMELWERKVTDIHIQGILRRKVLLILENKIENEENYMIQFEITSIDENEWKALDYFLEEVECGKSTEKELLNNETFLHMLSTVKFDSNNFMKIPDFIRMSKLTEKYCSKINTDIIESHNNTTHSQLDVYKEYLGI